MKLQEVSRLPLVISQKQKRFVGESERKVHRREREREGKLENGNQRVGKKKRFSNMQINARYYFIMIVTCIYFHVTN
jgi:hypothetical protein